MDYLYHCKEEIELNRLTRDGQFDAMLLENLYTRSGILYLIQHGLGRPVKQYQVVFCDRAIKVPACARNPAGELINTVDYIGLVFDADNVTVRMRFC